MVTNLCVMWVSVKQKPDHTFSCCFCLYLYWVVKEMFCFPHQPRGMRSSKSHRKMEGKGKETNMGVKQYKNKYSIWLLFTNDGNADCGCLLSEWRCRKLYIGWYRNPPAGHCTLHCVKESWIKSQDKDLGHTFSFDCYGALSV